MIEKLKADNDNLRHGSDVPTEEGFGEGRGRDEDCSPPPPRRSRRALLTHRAPPSGFGVEAVTGQWVQHPDWREEAVDEPDELLPGETGVLAAPFQRLEPEPPYLVEEPPQARVVARDGGPTGKFVRWLRCGAQPW